MSSNSEETIPQSALFPPPPPPQVAPSSMPWISVQGPRPMNVAMQHLPPPPPPPYPAVPSTSTSQLHNTVYRGQSPQPSTSSAISLPSMAVVMFDTTRPPPPMYALVEPNNNTLKRKKSTGCTAGPSKLCKRDEANGDDAMCDACVQREISIETYRIKMEKLNSEDECQSLLYNKKSVEYRRYKDFLCSIVGNNIFRRFEEFVEGVPQYNFHSVLNDDSYLTDISLSSVPKQMLLQIAKFFLSDSQKYESSTMSRSPVRRSSPDLLQTLQDMLYSEDRSSSSERPGYRELTLESAYSSGTNGVSRHYSNGQHVEQLAPPPPPVPATSSAPVPVPPAGTYPHYPPPRIYYPHPYQQKPRPSTSRAPVLPHPTYPVPHTPVYPPEPRPSTSRAPVSPRPTHAVPYTTLYPSEPRPSTSRAQVSPRPTHASPYTPLYPSEPRPSTSRAPVPPLPSHAAPYSSLYPSEPRPSTSRAPVPSLPSHDAPYSSLYPSEPRPSTSRAPHPTQTLPYTQSSYYYQ